MSAHRTHRFRQHEAEAFRTLDLVDWVQLLENDELHLDPTTEVEEPGLHDLVFVPRREDAWRH